MDRVLGFPSAKDDSYGGCQSGVETDNRYNDVQIHALWARRDITLTRPTPKLNAFNPSCAVLRNHLGAGDFWWGRHSR